MVVQEYCKRMERELDAWHTSVESLKKIMEELSNKDRQAARQEIEKLQTIIEGLGNVINMLKKECLLAN